MAFWKSDIVQINGYNETLLSWGYEDSELGFRLLNSGVKRKFLKMGGVQYHLDHPRSSIENAKDNCAVEEKTRESNLKWTNEGIEKYLSKVFIKANKYR